MRLKTIFLPVLLILFSNVFSQYPPPAGQEGSTAIHKDSAIFLNWASECTIEPGPMDISNPAAGLATAGEPGFAIGFADNQIVSLGDGGRATLTFEKHVSNGEGPDFAVFENSFLDDFLELAFVEVSSNGVDFFRFDAVSLTQTMIQIEAFGLLDATKLHNLAGKYRVEYGTPFDLDELDDDPALDKNHITHIRIIDVVGSISDEFATYDSQGNKVNDPWPTPFESSGFDLDAVGVIHEGSQWVDDRRTLSAIKVYPNPASDVLFIESGERPENIHLLICDLKGKPVFKKETEIFSDRKIEISLDNLEPGMYIGTVFSDNFSHSIKLIRN
ncbi:MAG: T9SS type A sorting domain-containing protein [Bacteroidales bacterium]|nr:T9SS type A sorting domain-containing protein [Bacteroidales bacterium]